MEMEEESIPAAISPDDEVTRLRRHVAELETRLAREAALAEDFRHQLELNPQVPWTAGPDGAILNFNQRWVDLTGRTREELLGAGWMEVPHPEDLTRMAEAWTHSVRTGEPYDIEHRIRLADGSYRWMHSRAYARRNAAGEIVRWYGTTEDIHDRRQAQEELLESENRFSAAFAEAPVGMVLTTPQGRILDVNRAYLDMLGYTAEELSGHDSARITHPEDVRSTERFFEMLQRRDASTAVLEKRYLRKNGQVLWARASATMRRFPNGQAMQLVAIIEDISAQKTAEAERERLLQQVEAERKRLEAVAEQMPSGLAITDAAGKLILFNAEAERILGHSLRETSGPPDFTRYGAVHRDGTPYAAEEHPLVRALLRGEVLRNEEMLYRRGDGRVTLLQNSAAPLYDDEGVISGAVVVFSDIAERRRMEEALRQNEEHLQQVFQQAPVAICVLRGRDLVYELVNPHYQELLPGRSLLGRPLLEAVPEVSSELLAILYGVLDTGQAFVANEFRLPLDRHGDGIIEDCWFNFVYQPLREPDGTVSGVVAVAVNVTGPVRAKQQLERTNRELEEFAYVASHDLQEPLRMVNIYTQLLMRELKPHLDDRMEQHAAYVQGGVKRMERMLKDLLSFSRIIYAETEDERNSLPANMNASLARALGNLQSRMEEVGAVVTSDPLPKVHGDEAQLSQVFQNLVSNALKYRKPHERPSVHISAQQNGREWVIAVRDNGIGFEQHHAERIFGLFKRLHKDAYPGTGLGLAIVKRIVERHGGRIWAESAPEAGSTFFLAMPGEEPRLRQHGS